jgi:hypothetical protein
MRCGQPVVQNKQCRFDPWDKIKRLRPIGNRKDEEIGFLGNQSNKKFGYSRIILDEKDGLYVRL